MRPRNGLHRLLIILALGIGAMMVQTYLAQKELAHLYDELLPILTEKSYFIGCSEYGSKEICKTKSKEWLKTVLSSVKKESL